MKKFTILYLLLSALTGPQAWCQPSYADKIVIDSAYLTGFTTVGTSDFDSDGDQDILYVIQNNPGNELGWLEHQPDGRLTTKHNLYAPGYTQQVSLANLDNLNGMDVVTLRLENDTFYLWKYRNTGSGQFVTSMTSTGIKALPDAALHIQCTDFDADGDDDVVLTQLFYLSKIWLFENTGNGTLAPGALMYSTTLAFLGFTTADLTADGHGDVVIKHQVQDSVTGQINQHLFFLKNDGTNHLSDPVHVFGPVNTELIKIADLSNDGFPDIATIGYPSLFGGTPVWMENDGSGNFPVEHDLAAVGDCSNMVFADMNGDNVMDILTLRGSTNVPGDFTLFINKISGEVDTVVDIINESIPFLESYYVLFALDWDMDGKKDILFPSGNIYLKKNLGQLQFEPRKTVMKGRIGDTFQPLVRDFNLDGHMDIMGGRGNAVGYYLNNGLNEFMEAGVPFQDSAMGFLYLADLNQDGAPDIIRPQPESNKLVWYPNDGAGHFGAPKLIRSATAPLRPRIRDFDGDGDLDVLFFYSNGGLAAVTVMRNDGNGNFVQGQGLSLGQISVEACVIIDADGDNDFDLTYIESTGKVVLYKNNGSAFFANKQIIHTASDTYLHIDGGDFDNDGDVDLVYVNWSSLNKVVVLKNNGSGVFSAQQQTIDLTAYNFYSLIAADLDGDNDLDIISIGDTSIYWLVNNGAGLFSTPQLLVDYIPAGFTIGIGDVDSDDDLDIVAGSGSYGELQWYQNQDLTGTHTPQFNVPGLQISPNPAADYSVITLPAPSIPYQINMADATGRVLYQETVQGETCRIGRNGLPAGVYHVWLTEQSGKVAGIGKLIWQ